MTFLAPSEALMWREALPDRPLKLADSEINEKYLKRELRIVTESNREQLPNFVEALHRPGWMDLRPFYQRRPRWNQERQSKLIESFIMNIPVPPLFVYEADLAKYEVMDGQQRITALRDFYANKFALKGLEQWPELNGRIYDKLPTEIRKGIDRRSISYIVLLKESATTTEEESLLRQQVFERLNTGGVELSNQEIRHCIYHGIFDELLLELTQHPVLRSALELPAYTLEETTNPPSKLLESPWYKKMQDAELVLRFFALRHSDEYRQGMQGFLDLYMVRARRFTPADITALRNIFAATIATASSIFEENLFTPWDTKSKTWSNRVQVAFADAVLVSISQRLDSSEIMIRKRAAIMRATIELFSHHPAGTFTGRSNTKQDVKDRIRLFGEMLDRETRE